MSVPFLLARLMERFWPGRHDAPRSTPMTGKVRKTRKPAHSSICATSMDWDLSPAWPSRSASSRRRRLTARAVSDSRTLAPSSATRLSAADRSRSSSTRTSSPSAPRACHGVWPVIRALASASRIRPSAQLGADLAGRHQRLGHAAAAGQVHRDQVEEHADRVPEVAAPLGRALPQLQVGQEEERAAQDQADPQRDDEREVEPATLSPSSTIGPSRNPNRPSRTLVAR